MNQPICKRNDFLKSEFNSGLSGNVLPIHPQPKEDEIFSSWLCRIAMSNGIKLHTLEVKIWDRTKQIWTRDIDRSIDEKTLGDVAHVCGTPKEHALQTALSSYEGILFQKLNSDGHSTWITPAGVFHRKRKRNSMHYCPLCLGTDEIPYFRKKWRLALSTFCDKHGVLLHDCCYQCKAPVSIHRQELGNRWSSKVESLSLCVECGFDLKRAPGFQAPIFDIQTWLTFTAQLTYLDFGWTFNKSQTFQFSPLYFDVLRDLITKLRSPWTPNRLLSHFCEQFHVSLCLKKFRTVTFEFLPVYERHVLLSAASWYLDDWPNRLLTAAKLLKIRYSELMREFSNIPYWYQSQARCLEFNPLGPSMDERQAMYKLLQNTRDPKAHKQLRRAVSKRLGCSSVDKFIVEMSQL